MNKRLGLIAATLIYCTPALAELGSATSLYWGDTHLHTKLSGDSYIMQNRSLGPDEAYRYAKGIPVVNAKTRHKIQIGTPLDFLVVSDHAEYMGVLPRLFEGDPQLTSTNNGKMIADLVAQGKAREAFLKLVATVNTNIPYADLNSDSVRQSVWNGIVESAERHNEPGKFTSLIGWEWSSLPGGANLHRIVFMKEDGDVAKRFVPYSAFDSDKPEDLWHWLDQTEQQTGASFVAIPHNGNVSKGRMFATIDSEGKPLTAEYARKRSRWEPIYEMTQIKGDGETLGALSPNDEFADFETYNHALDATPGAKTQLPPNKGDYARSALMRGLETGGDVGVNPFKFAMIGASDSHSGVTAVEEDNFGGKFPIDSYPEGKAADLTPGTTGYDMSAAGLAGVWASENTREDIFAAFQRKEVYGTTGPRIQLRFFGGWDFQAHDAKSIDVAGVGYARGVPMGGDLNDAPKGRAPSFLIQAAKDPVDANLDRIQVVKGWLDKNGASQEKVFNVAAADGRPINDNALNPVGNTVNVNTAQYHNSIGDPQLATVWTDPEFNPAVAAFYYVRVLQIPTPRHTLYAAVALNQAPPTGIPTSIQERAYSSPIWYTP
jgi:hypothetical protein